VLGVFATVYDFLIRVIPVYVLGVFATVYDFLIRVIPVYVLGVFATVYEIAEISKITEKNHSCIYMTAQFPDRHSNEKCQC
jgi:hypothetical protein